MCMSVKLRRHNVNHGLLWVGGSVSETSVDTDCQSKIMMCGWIGGRDICGHRLSIKYHDMWVDRQKIICGHRLSMKDHDVWVDRQKIHLWTLQLQTEFVKTLLRIFNAFSAVTKKTGKTLQKLKQKILVDYHYLMWIARTLSGSWCTCRNAVRQNHTCAKFSNAYVLQPQLHL